MLSERMETLFQDLFRVARQFGYQIRTVSEQRTCAEQLKANPALKCSLHLTGDAMDIRVEPIDPFAGLHDSYKDVQVKLGARAESLGFRWGGEFGDPDPNHFDDGNRVTASCCGSGGVPRRRRRLVGRKKDYVRPRRRQPNINITVCPQCGQERSPEYRRTVERVDESYGSPLTARSRERRKGRTDDGPECDFS